MKRKPKRGEILFEINTSTPERKQVATPVMVVRVGRNDFACVRTEGPHCRRTYLRETWIEKARYAPRYKLYATEQEWKDERDAGMLASELKTLIDNVMAVIPLPVLRQIRSILKQSARANATTEEP